MAGFLNPLWFIALAIIPIIRWLHRWQAPTSTWPVSAVFLWDSSVRDDTATGTRKKPDPAWRRRALVVALLIGALAGPFWQDENKRLTVWVDDSLSMMTQENGKSRLTAVMETLAADLDRSGSAWSEIRLRSLTDASRTEIYGGGTSSDATAWQTDSFAEPAGPPAAIMSGASSHWLMTDGASEGVRTWASRVHLDRLIQSGATTENSAVTRIAARRSLDQADQLDVLVSISNAGLDAATRRLELYGGQQLLQSVQLFLSPGETFNWQTRGPFMAQTLTAVLAPGDALLTDDSLAISLEEFVPLATAVASNCPAALRLALRAHPALKIVDLNPDVDLNVQCPRTNFPDEPAPRQSIEGAEIRVFLGAAHAVTTAPTWSSSAVKQQALMLPVEWLAAAPWPAVVADTAHKVVLRSAANPLVVLRTPAATDSANNTAATIVDIVVDMGQAQFTRQPEYAAFVATLVDVATQRQLLDESVSASRNPKASIVIPAAIKATSTPVAATSTDHATPLSALFLAAAMLVLALDAILLLRGRRERRHA